jgi:hypothetical protein
VLDRIGYPGAVELTAASGVAVSGTVELTEPVHPTVSEARNPAHG